MASLVRVCAASCIVVAALAGCGGDDGDGAGDGGGGTIVARIGPAEGGLIDLEGVTCRRDGEQLLAAGIVRNRSDVAHYVSISIRFVDEDDVRVELTTDSVSDLQTGESARWEATVYASAADTVVNCDVTAEAS